MTAFSLSSINTVFKEIDLQDFQMRFSYSAVNNGTSAMWNISTYACYARITVSTPDFPKVISLQSSFQFLQAVSSLKFAIANNFLCS